MEESATLKQKEFARSLGIEFDPNIGKNDISRLIGLVTDRPSEDLLGFAEGINVDTFERTGRHLKGDIFSTLKKGGDLPLTQWFVHRVARDRELKFKALPLKIDSEVIKNASTHISSNPKVIKSIHRYSDYDINFFGTFTSKDGYVNEGGSRNTIAYKEALKALQDNGLQSVPTPTPTPKKPSITSGNRPSKHNKMSTPPAQATSSKMSDMQVFGWFVSLSIFAALILMLIS